MEQHINQTKIVPSIQREIQNSEKIQIQPMVQRINQNITQREILQRLEMK